MMWWSGGWGWLMMLPMLVLVWVVVATVAKPWVRQGSDRRPTALELLDERLASGDIDVEHYRALRHELERHRAPQA